ncbi:amino acid permease [Candidatus Woesearchaeota archaeon]|nr:amino acid permease [Candidatus Woesearchaeota archaeon]
MAELKKGLGFWTIIALTLTSMVGTGMFLGTSIGAGYAGNGVLLAWAFVLIIAVYVAACFGELTAMLPRAGGVYEFSKKAYGRFVSFLIGWLTWLMANIGFIVLLIAAMNYVLPASFSADIFYGLSYKLLIAAAIIIIMNLVAYFGVDTSAAVLIVFAFITVALFLSIIIPGFMEVNMNNFAPFMTKPFFMVFVAMFFMMEALMGWESASFLSEETKNPEKTIPKALVISTIIAGLLGIGTAFISLGIINWSQLVGSAAPMSDVANIIFGAQGSKLISWGIILTLMGSAVGVVISTPRLLLAMARDKLFISQLARIHKKWQTPYNAIIFQCIVSVVLLLAAAGKYELLLSMFTPLALVTYVFVLLALPILRRKMPEANRPFKVPFGKFGPILISLIYLAIIIVWLYTGADAINIFRLIISLLLFGIPIYLVLIFLYNPDAIVSFSNYFAHLTLWMENILLPKYVRKQITGIFRDIEGKSILEYGAGVGTLTLHLAELVGPKGRIFATDLSHRNIHLLRKRLEKKGIKHVTVIHDEHQVNRVHPSVESVDIIFSVGMISYIQDIKKILTEMNRRLPEAGRICFVEYVNFFRVLPDAALLSDITKLKNIFREAGFSVQIDKRKGLLWNYLFIYGIKSERDVPMI